MAIEESPYDGYHGYPWYSEAEMNTPRIAVAELLSPEMEGELVTRAVRGNREAFGRLYDTYFDFVYDAASCIEGNHPDSELLVDRIMSRHAARLFSGDQTIVDVPYRQVLLRDFAAEAQRDMSLRERVQRKLLGRIFPERYENVSPDLWLQFSRDERILLSLVYKGGLTPQEAADALQWDVYYCMDILDHAHGVAKSASAEFSETE